MFWAVEIDEMSLHNMLTHHNQQTVNIRLTSVNQQKHTGCNMVC